MKLKLHIFFLSCFQQCLNIFGIESREGHQGLYRLRYGPAHFLLVAHPASPYRLAVLLHAVLER